VASVFVCPTGMLVGVSSLFVCMHACVALEHVCIYIYIYIYICICLHMFMKF
jgi:hypothetical protein